MFKGVCTGVWLLLVQAPIGRGCRCVCTHTSVGFLLALVLVKRDQVVRGVSRAQ